VLSILLPASAMVRERERGTVEQLLVSPLSPAQIIIPKIAAMALVILLGATVSLFGLLRAVFHVPARGSLTLLFVVTTIFVFTTAGLGLFLTTIARNLAQVGMLVSAALPPMVFLSGAWSPPEAMPVWLRIVMNLSPLHYYLDITFGILLGGAGLVTLWQPIATLIAIGGTVLGFGVWRFRRQFG
jgi:ABC-2 type transport system permease protein